MSGLGLRPYAPADREACLQVFLSNTPTYFGADEMDDFRQFLEQPTCDFFVVTRGGELVACGGHGYHGGKQAVILAWGMVRADLHRQGLGEFLLVERLHRIHRDFGDTPVTIETSQHSRGFFERYGFIAGQVLPDHFAPGIDRVDMCLDLTRASLPQRTGSLQGQ